MNMNRDEIKVEETILKLKELTGVNYIEDRAKKLLTTLRIDYNDSLAKCLEHLRDELLMAEMEQNLINNDIVAFLGKDLDMQVATKIAKRITIVAIQNAWGETRHNIIAKVKINNSFVIEIRVYNTDEFYTWFNYSEIAGDNYDLDEAYYKRLDFTAVDWVLYKIDCMGTFSEGQKNFIYFDNMEELLKEMLEDRAIKIKHIENAELLEYNPKLRFKYKVSGERETLWE